MLELCNHISAYIFCNSSTSKKPFSLPSSCPHLMMMMMIYLKPNFTTKNQGYNRAQLTQSALRFFLVGCDSQTLDCDDNGPSASADKHCVSSRETIALSLLYSDKAEDEEEWARALLDFDPTRVGSLTRRSGAGGTIEEATAFSVLSCSCRISSLKVAATPLVMARLRQARSLASIFKALGK